MERFCFCAVNSSLELGSRFVSLALICAWSAVAPLVRVTAARSPFFPQHRQSGSDDCLSLVFPWQASQRDVCFIVICSLRPAAIAQPLGPRQRVCVQLCSCSRPALLQDYSMLRSGWIHAAEMSASTVHTTNSPLIRCFICLLWLQNKPTKKKITPTTFFWKLISLSGEGFLCAASVSCWSCYWVLGRGAVVCQTASKETAKRAARKSRSSTRAAIRDLRYVTRDFQSNLPSPLSTPVLNILLTSLQENKCTHLGHGWFWALLVEDLFHFSTFPRWFLKKRGQNSCICDCGGKVWQVSVHLNPTFIFTSSASIFKNIFNRNKPPNFQSWYIPHSPGTPILD